MESTSTRPRKIAVIGGGISGLAAAHRLRELDADCDVALFEASDRLGGVLQTERRDGFLIERGADMFTTREPWALDLCKRIGFEDQLIETNDQHRQAFVVRQGKLVPLPGGFSLMSPNRMWPIVTTPILSPLGKLRLAWEYFTSQKRDHDDESLAAFAKRRFGRQTYERLIQPLIGGIYTADPEKLSMAATMPQFVQMERQYRGLIRATRKLARQQKSEREASGARYGMFLAPRDGMASFVNAIADRLPANCARLGVPVEELVPTDNGGWEITANRKTERFDAALVATHAPHAAELLSHVDATLADDLKSIEYAGAAVVVLAYRREQLSHAIDGFGFVAPLIENRKILACSFASVKFAGRAPDDCVLLRVFAGGACQPELVELRDSDLLQLVREELSGLIGASGDPILTEINRWHGAMPQYHVGHLDLVDRIEQTADEIPNLELAGNAYRGVGIPFCVHSGEQAAQRVMAGE